MGHEIKHNYMNSLLQHYTHQWKKEFPATNYKILHIQRQIEHDSLKALIKKHMIDLKIPWNKFKQTTHYNARIMLIEDGSMWRGYAPLQVKDIIKGKSRGLDLFEGISLAILYPEILQHHSLDLIESQYGHECIPTLYYWNDRVNLSAICPDVSDNMCGAPTVIKEVQL